MFARGITRGWRLAWRSKAALKRTYDGTVNFIRTKQPAYIAFDAFEYTDEMNPGNSSLNQTNVNKNNMNIYFWESELEFKNEKGRRDTRLDKSRPTIR